MTFATFIFSILAGWLAFLPAETSLPNAVAPNETIPPSLFGMESLDPIANAPTVSIGALHRSGCVAWSAINRSRGSYDWSVLDGAVNAASARHVDYLYSTDGVPGFAVSDQSGGACSTVQYCGESMTSCTKMPDNISDWDNFYTALVKRYRRKIQFYELWNEPYNHQGIGRITAADMATLARHAYNIIRANDPDARIVGPSMGSGPYYEKYAAAYFAAGGPTGVDIASLHIYSDNAPLDAPEGVVPGGALLSNAILSIIRNALPGKPIWNTEGSWDVDNGSHWNTPDTWAAFVSRWYILHWSSGISRAYWYAWDHTKIGTLMPALIGSRVPATAYEQTYNWLVGRMMPSPCVEATDNRTWTCGLVGVGGYRALIVWDTAGNTSYMPPNPGMYTRYRDLAGNIVPYSGDAITIGIKPVIFDHP